MSETPLYHAVSLSGGKDSTAMLLLMVDHEMPIDCVICADTGMEFPEMYEHLNKVDDWLFRERGLHITYLRHPMGFEGMMFRVPNEAEKTVKYRQENGISLLGKGWPTMRVRWCTGELKTHLIDTYVSSLKEGRKVQHYVGIAADEPQRVKKACYPLVDWHITEADALAICYNRGFNWGGLYELHHRCSCWCCPLQRIDELRKLRKHHPELWRRLRDMDCQAREQFGNTPLGQFKERWSVEALEQRFAAEDDQETLF